MLGSTQQREQVKSPIMQLIHLHFIVVVLLIELIALALLVQLVMVIELLVMSFLQQLLTAHLLILESTQPDQLELVQKQLHSRLLLPTWIFYSHF